MLMVIYEITNLSNEKIYVGQTKQSIKKRFLQHSKADSPLGQAMRESGLENFTIEIIERCKTQAELNERERFWIKVLKSKSPNGYNLTDGGAGFVKQKNKNYSGDSVVKIFSEKLKTLRERKEITQTELLGEWIKDYRLQHDMTMQEMADVCGFSKAYISMLEKGINPTTNKPVSPTMQAFEKIAVATGQDVDSLLKILDGEQPITIRPNLNKISAEETKLIDGYRALDSVNKNLIMTMISQLNFGRAGQGSNDYLAESHLK